MSVHVIPMGNHVVRAWPGDGENYNDCVLVKLGDTNVLVYRSMETGLVSVQVESSESDDREHGSLGAIMLNDADLFDIENEG